MRYRDIEKILLKGGYVLVRGKKSSQKVFRKPGTRPVTVSYKTKDFTDGYLRALEKQTGLSFLR